MSNEIELLYDGLNKMNKENKSMSEIWEDVEKDIEEEERQAKNRIELMDDVEKNFITEEMYPIIPFYSACLRFVDDYINFEDVVDAWFDFLCDYYEVDVYNEHEYE